MSHAHDLILTRLADHLFLWNRLDSLRDEVSDAYAQAEDDPRYYPEADELSADLHEAEAEIGALFAEQVRALLSTTHA